MARTQNIFRLRGTYWRARTYKRSGETRYCYEPKNSHEPVFSDTRLTKEQLGEIIDKRQIKIEAALKHYQEYVK